MLFTLYYKRRDVKSGSEKVGLSLFEKCEILKNQKFGCDGISADKGF